MALGLGEGAELRAPLAVTVIGGLTVATALTLIVIPVVYSYFARGALVLPAADREEAPLSVPAAATTGDGAMNLPRLAVHRPVTTAMILASVLLIGVLAMVRLPLACLPGGRRAVHVHRDPVPELAPRAGRATDHPARGGGAVHPLRRQEAELDLDPGRRPVPARVHVGAGHRPHPDEGQREGRPGRAVAAAGHRPDPDPLVQHRRHPGGRGQDLRRGGGPVRELRAARGAGAQPVAPDPRRGPGRPRRRRAARAVHRPRARQGQGARRRRRRSGRAPRRRVRECGARRAHRAGAALHRPLAGQPAHARGAGRAGGRRARAAPVRHRRDLVPGAADRLRPPPRRLRCHRPQRLQGVHRQHRRRRARRQPRPP